MPTEKSSRPGSRQPPRKRREKLSPSTARRTEVSPPEEPPPEHPREPKYAEATPLGSDGIVSNNRPKLIADLPPHVELAWGELEEAGFRLPAEGATVIGNYAWIECRAPVDTAANPNYRPADHASKALRKVGLYLTPEDIQIKEFARRAVVLIRLRLPTELAYNPMATRLRFRPLPGGGISVEKPFSDVALLNTYKELTRVLEDVYRVVRREKTTSASALAKKFVDTILEQAADYARWTEWAKYFAAGELTAKNAALVLLEDGTGLKRSTLKTRLSRARSKSKR